MAPQKERLGHLRLLQNYFEFSSKNFFSHKLRIETVPLFVIRLFVVSLVIESLSNEPPVPARGFKSSNDSNVLIQSVFNSFVSNRRVP